MGIYVHFQLLATALIHLGALVTGLTSLSTLFIAKNEAGGKCLLFAKGIALDNDHTEGSRIVCDFTAYLTIVSSSYALLLLIYYGAAAKVAFTREQHVGRSLWVMPFMLITSLVTVFIVIGASLVNLGFSRTCEDITEVNEKITLSCGEALRNWLKTDGKQVESRLKMAERAYWAHLVCWLCALALLVVRFLRNRRARSVDTISKDDSPFPEPSIATSKTTSDTQRLAEMSPTA